MRDTIIIRERFYSRDDAEEARERLEYSGFAHSSINIMRIGDEYELAIHTRPENRDQVQDCLSRLDFMSEARRYGREMSEHAPSPSQIALLFGIVGAVGAAVYYAYTRRRDLYAETYPARDRSAVRRLYEAHRMDTRLVDGQQARLKRPHERCLAFWEPSHGIERWESSERQVILAETRQRQGGGDLPPHALPGLSQAIPRHRYTPLARLPQKTPKALRQ